MINDDLKKSVKHGVKVTMFKLLKDITGIEIPWGILVGIRPTKIVNDLKFKNTESSEIYRILKEKYLLRDDKIRLVTEVSDNSYDIINNDKRTISIYVGIPFCPTRCVYCSFASYPIGGVGSYVKNYMSCLRYEIEHLSKFINDNFKVETIYVGGGTPTSLGGGEFKTLLSVIYNCFDIRSLKEFTVEAGRPDTINEAKLKAMAEFGVDRISINPQTMNDDTLRKIGRNHSVEDIKEKFHMARNLGFDNINMDIILGLPGETIEHVKNTLSQIIKLSPENITAHSLAVKRASKLKEKIIDNEYMPDADMESASAMMDYVQKKLSENDYVPYYMYRQKMMVGNLENVGYCKKGYECIYNIQMIEEKETIAAFGADAVSKIVFHDENRLERFANKKDLKEYINTIADNSDKKLQFLKLLT
jgi:oxygen-independent coproporphyrinogen-3 oxidase